MRRLWTHGIATQSSTKSGSNSLEIPSLEIGSPVRDELGQTFEQIFPGVDLAVQPVEHPIQPAQGQVELLSCDFAIGWACICRNGACAHVLALLDGEVIGCSRADIVREDLESAKLLHSINARAFVIAFYTPVTPSVVNRIGIRVIENGCYLPVDSTLKVESHPPFRIFVLGSPRSGTSQLGATLAECLSIPWSGEAHVAPRFAVAADQLSGDRASPNEFVRALDAWNFRAIAIDATRRGYFFLHSSSSFLDKTPGVAMVRAAPFMAECFPDAKFVFLRRHPVANIVSRMARFGGDFEEHCNDWTVTMQEWMRIRPMLPNHLDLEQEEMAGSPEQVAVRLAQFLGVPGVTKDLAKSISSGYAERTGAGRGINSIAQTDWSLEQKTKFVSICDVTMRSIGYRLNI